MKSIRINHTVLKAVIVSLFMAFCATGMSGQIKYDGTTLLIGSTPVSQARSYQFGITGYKGLYWQNNSTFFKVSMDDGVSFSGSNGFVDFYHAPRNAYQSLKCYNYTAWGTIVDSIGVTGIASPISLVAQLHPVEYRMKQSAAPSSIGGDDDKQLGLLAQEIEKLFPHLVTTDDNGNKLVNYIGLLPVLTKAFDEINGIIERQSAEIEELKQLLNQQ